MSERARRLRPGVRYIRLAGPDLEAELRAAGKDRMVAAARTYEDLERAQDLLVAAGCKREAAWEVL